MIIELATIRKGVEAVLEVLLNAKQGCHIAIDALTYHDLEIAVLALVQAEEQGKYFIYRTAASFVKIRGGLQDQRLLEDSLGANGLIMVGSYVKKQQNKLLIYQSNNNLQRSF